MTNSNNNWPVVFLMGPTASGKTALAIDLVQQGAGDKQFEIISVDSAMVYLQMNIGSAKPNDKELVLAPHHLIDFIDPKESYSASQFCEDAKQLIKEIHSRGNIPLLVGGTMLYFKSLRDGLADLPSTDDEIRAKVKQELESEGIESLHKKLSQIDQKSAERLHTNDTQRITRALEVFYMTGKTLTDLQAKQSDTGLKNPILSIALAPADRSVLHKRIEKRFEQMIEDGFLDEVASLYYRGDLNLDMPSMRSVGYRQIWQYLDNELTLSEAKERAVTATRQLAKRQYTWLRRWENAKWFDPTDEGEADRCKATIKQFCIEAHSKLQ